MHLFMEVVTFPASWILCDILGILIKYERAHLILISFRHATDICLTVIGNHVLHLEIQ